MDARQAYALFHNYLSSNGGLGFVNNPEILVSVDKENYEIASIDFSDADDVYGNDAIYIRVKE
jgi:hypothetical protein